MNSVQQHIGFKHLLPVLYLKAEAASLHRNQVLDHAIRGTTRCDSELWGIFGISLVRYIDTSKPQHFHPIQPARRRHSAVYRRGLRIRFPEHIFPGQVSRVPVRYTDHAVGRRCNKSITNYLVPKDGLIMELQRSGGFPVWGSQAQTDPSPWKANKIKTMPSWVEATWRFRGCQDKVAPEAFHFGADQPQLRTEK